MTAHPTPLSDHRSEGEHTPGFEAPWCVQPFSAWVMSSTIGKDGEPLPVCAMLWPTDERSEADTLRFARLIAAAPELKTELAASTAEMMGVVARLRAAGLGSLVGGVARQCDMNRAAIARATHGDGI